MKKFLFVLGIIIFIFVLIIGLYLAVKILRPKAAGIYIDTTPSSTVYINGQQVGRTPHINSKNKAGEILIRLVPDSYDIPLMPYDTKLDLAEGVQTVLKREFGPEGESSTLEQFTFEKISKNKISLEVRGNVNGAKITFDGQIKAMAPYFADTITKGEHQITLEADGYQSKQSKFKVFPGYKISVYIELKKENSLKQNENTNEETSLYNQDEFVEVLNTPVGFLRVRSDSSTEAEEISRVEVGKQYKLIEESEDKEWFKIEYEEGKEGWVSSQYVKKVDVTLTVSLSPSTSPSTSPKPSITISPTIKLTPMQLQ